VRGVHRRRAMPTQRYIHNPLLIDKLKFHLRLYVVILATAPVLSAFICRDGTCKS
jgi:hypothetical protein